MGGRQIAAILGIAALGMFAVAAVVGTSTVRHNTTNCGSALHPKTFQSDGSGPVQAVGSEVFDVGRLVADFKTLDCNPPITRRRESLAAVAGIGIVALLAAALLMSRERFRVARHV